MWWAVIKAEEKQHKNALKFLLIIEICQVGRFSLSFQDPQHQDNLLIDQDNKNPPRPNFHPPKASTEERIFEWNNPD